MEQLMLKLNVPESMPEHLVLKMGDRECGTILQFSSIQFNPI